MDGEEFVSMSTRQVILEQFVSGVEVNGMFGEEKLERRGKSGNPAAKPRGIIR